MPEMKDLSWLSFIASCLSFSLMEHSSSSNLLCRIPTWKWQTKHCRDGRKPNSYIWHPLTGSQPVSLTSFLRSSAARDSRVQSMKALPLLLLVLPFLPFTSMLPFKRRGFLREKKKCTQFLAISMCMQGLSQVQNKIDIYQCIYNVQLSQHNRKKLSFIHI